LLLCYKKVSERHPVVRKQFFGDAQMLQTEKRSRVIIFEHIGRVSVEPLTEYQNPAQALPRAGISILQDVHATPFSLLPSMAHAEAMELNYCRLRTAINTRVLVERYNGTSRTGWHVILSLVAQTKALMHTGVTDEKKLPLLVNGNGNFFIDLGTKAQALVLRLFRDLGHRQWRLDVNLQDDFVYAHAGERFFSRVRH
jgi:hypothetical protein